MLDVLRSKAGGWVAKIFIGLLALSFAVWGIADIFGGYRADALATVGDRTISVEQYRLALDRQLRLLAQRSGRSLTAQQARAIGIDRQVLGELIRDAALEAQASRLGLAIPDAVIAERITANPAFRGLRGEFSRERFRNLLANSGLTEASFFALERQNMLRQAIASLVERGLTPPQTLAKAAFRYGNEQRVARYFTIPEAAAGTVEEPSAQDLKAYYEKNQRPFTTPELRALTLLRVEPKDVATSIAVSEAELTAAYERRKDSLGTPERREIQQIPFPDLAAAEAARARIAGGADFLEIARERGLTEKDANLGWVTRGQILDKTVAAAAFDLKEGDVSAPIAGQLATVLVRVVRVVAGIEKNFAEVRSELEQLLKLERAKEEILTLHGKIEDARAGGEGIAEVGGKLNLPVIRVEAVDSKGNGADGKPVEGLPIREDALRVAFESDVGVENDPIETPDDGYVWLEVSAVTPEAVKPFAEVEGEVKRLWHAEKMRQALRGKAEGLLKRAQEGQSLDTLAAEVSAPMNETQPLRRAETAPDFPATAVAALFEVGANGVALAPSGASFILLQAARTVAAPYDPLAEQGKRMVEAVGENLANDLLDQYVAALERTIGVRINETLWSRLSAGQS